MAQEIEQSLRADKLCTGDRPSIIAAGMAVAHMIKEAGCCLMAVDAMGRVVVCPQSSFSLIAKPKVSESDLNGLSEEDAIGVMVREGRSDEEILSYLKTR